MKDLALICNSRRWRMPDIAHGHEFGGGCLEDADAPSEDMWLWAPERGLFVTVSGHGYAPGLLGQYLSSAPLAAAILGTLAGLLAPDDPDVGAIAPGEASEAVRACWSLGAELSPVVGEPADAIAHLQGHLLALMPRLAERVPTRGDFFGTWVAGMPCEVLIVQRRGRTLHLEAVGAYAVLHRRGRVVRQILPIGTLAEHLRASGEDTTDTPEFYENILLSSMGLIRDDAHELANHSKPVPVATATLELEPGDALGIYNMGVHRRLERAQLVQSLREPDLETGFSAIAEALAGSSAKCTRHPTAVIMQVLAATSG